MSLTRRLILDMILTGGVRQDKLMLTKAISVSRIIILLFVVSCALASCTSDVKSRDDYIGFSKPAQEPNISDTPAAGVAPEQPAVDGPLNIDVTQAILLALENNRSLVVQRFNPQIMRTLEQRELAVFDPDLAFQFANTQDNPLYGPTIKTRANSIDVGIQQFLPTGTLWSVTGSTDIDLLRTTDDYQSRITFGATQSLLRGFGTAVNLASVNQARLDIKASQYELRGFVQAIVAQIEETYWDYALAEQQIDIYTSSLDLAGKQLVETQERIKVGNLAPSELAAAEAEVALRREALINARSDLAKTKLSMLRLINPPGDNLWNREIVLKSRPVSPFIELDNVEPHVALALQMRPELNQAKLLLQRDELEIVKTKNGLLPRLDLFITLGRSGYADSFGDSAGNINGDYYDTLAGVSFEYPPLNRAAEARHLRAVLTRDQARESINNLAQLAQVDVRIAYLEIVRAQEQVAATAATRKLQEEKLQAEAEKFRVGKSTSLLVAQAQRDLVASQISEIQAVVNHLKAFVELYRLEGSLLERRGIAGPGREPVKLPDMP
jgi:outer membrane protein TolC